MQYGLADEGYKLADDPYAVRSTIGLLGWRVELRPKTESRIVEFLHVMQIGVDGQAADTVRGATYQATAETHVVALQQGKKRFALTLNRTGKRGGLIAVTGEPAVKEEPFPETVEDH